MSKCSILGFNAESGISDLPRLLKRRVITLHSFCIVRNKCNVFTLFIYLFPEALKLFPADKESNFILKYLICTNVCLISLVIDNVTETQTNGTDPRTEKLFCIWGAYHSLASLFKCRRSHFL